MARKLREYATIGLLSILSLGGCVSNPDAVEDSGKILNATPKSFIPRRAHLTGELDIYKKGTAVTETADGYFMSYPLRHRDATKLVDPVTKMFPGCTVISDSESNSLLVRVPYTPPSPTAPQPIRDGRLNELKNFIEGRDIKSPQYDIQTYVVQFSASELHRVRSSLDILAESGDVKLALNSTQLNKGPVDSGFQQTATGILDTFQLSALFNGLEQYGIVRNFYFATTVAEEGETAKLESIRKIPVPRIFPAAPVPVIGYEHIEVKSSTSTTAHLRADGFIELDLKLTRGSLLPSGMNFQPQVPLHDISTRGTEVKTKVRLGTPLVLTTTLDDNSIDIDGSSPLGKVFSSNSLKETNRVYELAVVLVNRIDQTVPSEGFPTEELDRQLNLEGSKK